MAETRRIVITIRHGKGKRPTPSNPKPTPSRKAKKVVEDPEIKQIVVKPEDLRE